MKQVAIGILAVLISVAPCVAQQDKPDPSLTPGVTNPNVTQANIKSTICVSGFTKKIRPTVQYTTGLKRQQIKQYGFSDKKLADYEEDHLISLEIGGHPRDPGNLWPESYNTQPWNARVKDRLENYLHAEVCAGRMPLQQAQDEIAHDWIGAYQKYLGQP